MKLKLFFLLYCNLSFSLNFQSCCYLPESLGELVQVHVQVKRNDLGHLAGLMWKEAPTAENHLLASYVYCVGKNWKEKKQELRMAPVSEIFHLFTTLVWRKRHLFYLLIKKITFIVHIVHS